MQIEEYERNYRFEETYWWYVGRRTIVLDFIHRYFGDKSNLKIVDLGCGTGLLTKYLSRYGDTWSVEAFKEAIEFSLKRGMHNLVQATVTNVPFLDDTFDVIGSFDVLEHIEDDEQAIKEMRRIVNKTGLVIMLVPAYQFLWSGEDVVSQHRRRYTRSTLKRKIESCGFKIEKISYINTFLFPLVALTIFLKKIFDRGSLRRSNLQELPHWLNFALGKIFAAESAILKYVSLPFGTSILCLAKKV